MSIEILKNAYLQITKGHDHDVAEFTKAEIRGMQILLSAIAWQDQILRNRFASNVFR